MKQPCREETKLAPGNGGFHIATEMNHCTEMTDVHPAGPVCVCVGVCVCVCVCMRVCVCGCVRVCVGV